MFEADGVFAVALIDAFARLRDANEAATGDLDSDESAREELIRRYWHVG